MKIRLEKIISSQNNLSRKQVKKLIQLGNVLVNDKIEKNPSLKIDPLINKVIFNNKIIEYKEFIYIALNKPKKYICATKDNFQPTILELVNEYSHFNLHIAGRLDKDTTGLVLLTNDGNWSYKLKGPKANIEKEYEVTLKHNLTKSMIKQLQGEIILDNKILKPIKIIQKEINTCNIILSEGKYHQIKRMFHLVDNEVVELNRIRIGRLRLEDLDIAIGEWKEINDNY